MEKSISVKQINETEYIIYLLNEDGVRLKAFVESGLESAQLRVNELSATEDINSIEITK
jgi:hypothetical protein